MRTRPATCPLCDSHAARETFPYEHAWGDRRFSFFRCSGCSCSFVWPRPTEADLLDVYEWTTYHERHYADGDSGHHIRTIDRLRRFSPPPARVLDFGCGAGGFLRAAGEAGYEPYGVELTQSAIAGTARTSGLPVSAIEDIERSGARFDIVYMSDVFPHLLDPVRECHRLLELMTPGGRLVLANPLEDNASLVYWTSAAVKGLRRALGGAGSPPNRPPTMLVRLTRSAHARFFEDRLGLRPLHIETFETGWPYLAADGDVSPGATVKRLIGRAAVRLASIGALEGLQLGNRCLALYELPTYRGVAAGARA